MPTKGSFTRYCSSATSMLNSSCHPGAIISRERAAGGENTSSNTRDFNTQVGTNGVNWTTVVTPSLEDRQSEEIPRCAHVDAS